MIVLPIILMCKTFHSHFGLLWLVTAQFTRACYIIYTLCITYHCLWQSHFLSLSWFSNPRCTPYQCWRITGVGAELLYMYRHPLCVTYLKSVYSWPSMDSGCDCDLVPDYCFLDNHLILVWICCIYMYMYIMCVYMWSTTRLMSVYVWCACVSHYYVSVDMHSTCAAVVSIRTCTCTCKAAKCST